MTSIRELNLHEQHEDDFLVEMRGISKRFPGVQALSDVSLSLRRGEVHGLTGENGAGKSTLLRILSGSHRADHGRIFFDGREVRWRNPADALRSGIHVIYQERTLIPQLTVAENIFVGRLHETRATRKRGQRWVVDWASLISQAQTALQRLGFDPDPRKQVSKLSVQEQQLVEIARALAVGGRLVIMDEPTAALPPDSVGRLFDIVRFLKSQGVSVVYVSHRLEEVFEMTDRITVLRDGQKVGTYETTSLTENEVVNLMVGRKLEGPSAPTSRTHEGQTVLRVQNLRGRGNLTRDVSFSLRKGEILGVAGLVGSGKEYLGRVIAGLIPAESGEIYVGERKVTIESPRRGISLGIGFLPADRKTEGLVLGMSLRENVTLSSLKQVSTRGIISAHREKELSERATKSVRLRYAGLEQQARSLSGGNQQRLSLARALSARSRILVFEEPTQGVDVGGKEEIHQLIREHAESGSSALVISSELPELLRLCHRIIVMANRQVVAEFDAKDATEEALLHFMIG